MIQSSSIKNDMIRLINQNREKHSRSVKALSNNQQMNQKHLQINKKIKAKLIIQMNEPSL